MYRHPGSAVYDREVSEVPAYSFGEIFDRDMKWPIEYSGALSYPDDGVNHNNREF